MGTVFAIDPGDISSGYALIEFPDFRLKDFGKISNPELLEIISRNEISPDAWAIEMMASYGMAVGKNVFDTCVWIGRFVQEISRTAPDSPCDFIFRKEEKISLCGSVKAKDANIRQALIDRYARHDFKTGKGTKANPDIFHGVAADAWQAIAVGVTWWDKHNQM